MIPAFGCYLFDIDGTLVDSAQDICGAVQSILGEHEHREVEFEFLKGYIGRHLHDLFGDLGYTPERSEELLQLYRPTYAARNHSLTSVYPGALEGIRRLAAPKATATTKGTPMTRVVLEKFGFLPYFNHVQGTDGFPAKPAPDVIFAALKGLGADPANCLFVGDSEADMEAGQRAGVKTCAVTYGYGKREDLARWSPDFWIGDLRELSPA